jgi:hypothetical protein
LFQRLLSIPRTCLSLPTLPFTAFIAVWFGQTDAYSLFSCHRLCFARQRISYQTSSKFYLIGQIGATVTCVRGIQAGKTGDDSG